MELSENINDSLFGFIKANAGNDPNSILLKYHNARFPFNLNFAVDQIISRKKTRRKLPDFIDNDRFLFPDTLAAEQATDQRVAKFHADLVGCGLKILDMTSGLGIDAMTIAMNGNFVVACDIVSNRSDILAYNASILGIDTLKAINCDSTSTKILNSENKFDLIFIDPARRGKNDRRLYSFEDCEPDIISLLPKLRGVAPRILIKASPMLDISGIKKMIHDISMIHIICVKGECKEVLVDINSENCPDFRGVNVVDLADIEVISELFATECDILSGDASIAGTDDIRQGMYIYEPNAGVMKLNCPAFICSKFDGLKQMAKNTSLYVSDKLYPAFPGRVSVIFEVPDKGILRNLRGEHICVVVRNYPLTADELRKKFKLKEGDDKFLYAFRLSDKNIPIICLTDKLKF